MFKTRKFFHLKGSYVNLSARYYPINDLHYSSSITIIFCVFFFFDAPNISLMSRFPEALLAADFSTAGRKQHKNAQLNLLIISAFVI